MMEDDDMKRYMIWTLCLGFLFLSFQCASSNKTKKQGSDKQSEEDVLKLLGISQNEQKTDGTATQQASSTLEQQLRQKDAEINQLKAELVLKDERIAELEKGRTQVFSTPMAGGDYTAQYNAALGIYRSGQYQEAISRFQSLLAQSMTHDLSDNCQYWIGECYYDLRNYRQAIVEFEKVFTFTRSNKDPDAQLKLGLCYMNLGDAAKAREEFNRLITNYPRSSYITRANSYLVRLKK